MRLPQSSNRNNEDQAPPLSQKRIWVFLASLLVVFWILFITNIYGAFDAHDLVLDLDEFDDEKYSQDLKNSKNEEYVKYK